MKIVKCWLLISNNDSGQIASVFSPDTKSELLADPIDIYKSRDMIIILAQYNLQDNCIFFPVDAEYISKIPIDPMQHWEFFFVEIESPKVSLMHVLPVIGNFCNFYSILSGAFVTFMALQTSSINNNDKYLGVSITGGILNFLFNIIIYRYSDAGTLLAKLGWHIDTLLQIISNKEQLNNQSFTENNVSDCKHNYTLYLLLFSVCIALNVSITGIKSFQEHSLLVDKFLSLCKTIKKHDYRTYRTLINWLVIGGGISSGAYCSVAFQLSFALKLINNLTDSNNLQGSSDRQRSLITNQYDFYTESTNIEREQDTSNLDIAASLSVFRRRCNYT